MSLDALVFKVEQWAYDRNLIEGLTPTQQFPKLIEEVGELAGSIPRNNLAVFKDSIGDIIVVLVILAAQKGFSLEDCLAEAYDEIKDRKGIVVDGIFVKEADL